jgi:FkbM family methyltransferase
MNKIAKALATRIPGVRPYLARVRVQRQALEKQIGTLVEQLAVLEQKLAELGHDRDRISEHRSVLEQKLAELADDRDRISEQRAVLEQKLAELADDRDRISEQRAVLEQTLEELADDRERISEQRAVLEQKLAELADDRERTSDEHDRLLAHVTSERDVAAEDLAIIRRALATVSSEPMEIGGRITALTSESDRLSSDLDQLLVFRLGQLLGRSVPHALLVKCLFQLILDRQPEPDEKDLYCQALAAGGTCESLVSELLLSPDGRNDRRNRERFPQIYDRNLRFPTLILPKDEVFPIRIVDVGAQLLSMMDHVYAPMLRDELCTVIGFEPLKEEANRRELKEPAALILPFFIGDGQDGMFHINAYNPTSSLYPPNPDMMKFRGLAIVLPTVSTEPAKTRRLDDISEIRGCDYLKIDVQGAELKVLSGAARLLETTGAIHLEVEHDQVYLGQPLFSDIDVHLRAAGFELIDLFAPGYDTYREAPPGCSGSRLLWHDALYMKRDDQMTDEMLLKAAYMAHANYRKYDLAAHLLAVYDGRRNTDLHKKYEQFFSGPRAL